MPQAQRTETYTPLGNGLWSFTTNPRYRDSVLELLRKPTIAEHNRIVWTKLQTTLIGEVPKDGAWQNIMEEMAPKFADAPVFMIAPKLFAYAAAYFGKPIMRSSVSDPAITKTLKFYRAKPDQSVTGIIGGKPFCETGVPCAIYPVQLRPTPIRSTSGKLKRVTFTHALRDKDGRNLWFPVTEFASDQIVAAKKAADLVAENERQEKIKARQAEQFERDWKDAWEEFDRWKAGVAKRDYISGAYAHDLRTRKSLGTHDCD